MTRGTYQPRLALLACLAAACSSPIETIIPPPPPPPAVLTGAAPFVVSNSVAIGPAGSAVQGSPGSDQVAFVSLAPGTLPGVTTVRIRIHRNGAVVSAALVGGGLDPVAVPAMAGDTITLTTTRPDGPEARLVFLVPVRKPPVIVRTEPRKNKRDVAINVRLLVVFSEPIDGASLTPQSISLRSGRDQIAAELRFANPEHTIVELIPAEDLAVATDYVLTLGAGIRDVEGTPIETGETIPFTTVTAPEQPGAISVSTVTRGGGLPSSYWISVDGGTAHPTGVNGGITFGNLAAGSHTVALTGAGVNCPSTGTNPRTVIVAPGLTAGVEFDMTCVPAPVTQLAFVRNEQIHLINSDGTGLVQLTNTGPGVSNVEPAWSPDGQRLAFVSTRAGKDHFDIYVMNADGSNVVRRTDGGYNANPAWSPDGRLIAFASVQDGSAGIFVMDADGGPGSRLVLNRPGYDANPAWSPDGTKITFTSDWRAYDFVYDLYIANADGTGIRSILEGPFFGSGMDYWQSAWSPNGQKIAVTGCFSWSYYHCYPVSDVAVVNPDGSGLTVLTAAGGLARPTWSPDGQTIAFASTCLGCKTALRFVRADGSAAGLITTDGHSPAWRH